MPNAVLGQFDDWIELENPSGTPIDLGGWSLTDDPTAPNKWTFPSGTVIGANSFFIVFASGNGVPDANANLHTNFKLSKSGENLSLVKPDNTIASQFDLTGAPYPLQLDDVSYGSHPSTGNPVYFSTPTPLATNDSSGVARVAPLTVSPTRGLYQTAQQVTLSTTTPAATIYYTTDGNPPLSASGAPSPSALIYSGAIDVDQITVIRAAATASGLSPSEPEAHTYLLLDIDNASTNGTDPAGLNAPSFSKPNPQAMATWHPEITIWIPVSAAQRAPRPAMEVSP